MEREIRMLPNDMTIKRLVDEAEPLCNGDTTDLADWIEAGAKSGGIHSETTAQDVADEWNDLTAQAEGH